MSELDKLFESMKPMAALFELMDNLHPEEKKKRDAEAEKERQHRIAEDLEADRREEARVENLEYRDECRKEREEYWEPNEL